MDCGDCRKRLEPYLDRELSAAEAQAVQFHLEDCASCVGEYAFMSHFSRLVKLSCSQDPIPAALLPKVRATLHQA